MDSVALVNLRGNHRHPLSSWVETGCLFWIISSWYRSESLCMVWSSQIACISPPLAQGHPHHLLFMLLKKLVRSARLSQHTNAFCSFVIKFCVSFSLNLLSLDKPMCCFNHNMVITKTEATKHFLATDTTQRFSPKLTQGIVSGRCREMMAELSIGRTVFVRLQDQRGSPPKCKSLWPKKGERINMINTDQR